MTSERFKHLLGRSGSTRMFEVEKGAIKRFADSIGDTNPLYWDDDYAKNTKYGGIVAPPAFFGWPCKWNGGMPFFDELQSEILEILAAEGFPRILDGGTAYEFYRPIMAGDTLASLSKVADIEEKETKSGPMFITKLEATFINQNGDMVAKQIKSIITR